MSNGKRTPGQRVSIHVLPDSLRIDIARAGPGVAYPWLLLAAAALLLFFWVKIMPWGKVMGAGESVADDWSAFAVLTPVVLVPLFFLLYRGLCLMLEEQAIVIAQGSVTLEKRLFGWSRSVSVALGESGNLQAKDLRLAGKQKCLALDLNRKTYSLGYLLPAREIDEVMAAMAGQRADKS